MKEIFWSYTYRYFAYIRFIFVVTKLIKRGKYVTFLIATVIILRFKKFRKEKKYKIYSLICDVKESAKKAKSRSIQK